MRRLFAALVVAFALAGCRPTWTHPTTEPDVTCQALGCVQG